MITGARCILALVVALVACGRVASDPLPSWREGAPKQSITAFVRAVSERGGPEFVPEHERIAVFDNDGTLWVEQPLYVQMVFMLAQLEAAAPEHPEWKSNPAFQAIEAHDQKALAALGQKPLLELLALANSGTTVGAYDAAIRRWLVTATHPRFQRRYTELVYTPMRELLGYLRANGFKTFIVSGGSVEFMRPWAEQAYGIPPEQIVGSQQEVEFQIRDGMPVLTRKPAMAFVDDGPGKPVGIYEHIGQRPLAAFGNSDGDLQMLQISAAGEGRRLLMLVHHDDAEREYAYDRDTQVGRLDRALDEAEKNGWTVVSMKSDWEKIFDFDAK